MSVTYRQGATRLDKLHQSGSAQIRLPRRRGEEMLEAILINTAGGLTGGDKFQWAVDAGVDASVAITTQACEKIYRSSGGSAEVNVSLKLHRDSRIDWLPQETIVFDRSRLRRNLSADLGLGARLLALEAVILGRTAMCETVVDASFRDRWRIRREGRLIFSDDVRLEGAVAEACTHAAVLGGRAAFATLVLVSEDAEDFLQPLLAVLDGLGGASAFAGKLVSRVVAPDGFSLRRVLTRAIGVLRGQPAPRVWSF